MNWSSRTTSIAGIQVSNWILAIVAVVVLWINAAHSVGEWAARYRATAMSMCRPSSVSPQAVNSLTSASS
jgi:hypothetical protein